MIAPKRLSNTERESIFGIGIEKNIVGNDGSRAIVAKSWFDYMLSFTVVVL